VAIVVGVAMQVCFPAEEPRHKGKTLSEWVALVDRKPPSHQAMFALGEMGDVAIPVLIEAMRTHRDGAIRWLSHVALAKVGQAALPELDKVMKDGDNGARIQAVLAFEKILGKEAAPRLREALDDRFAGVRVRAHGALLRLGEPKEKHLPAMVEILTAHPEARWIAAEALGSCREMAAGAEEGLAAVLDGSGKGVDARALRALEEIGTPEALEHVFARNAKELQSAGLGHAAKARAAARLGQAGAAARAAAPILRVVAKDRGQDILTRGYATWAAEQIEPRSVDEAACTYHVAQEHPRASDGNAGTEERPWQTIQHAAEVARPGDTVAIHDGVYREFVRPFLGGTGPDHMITYRAAVGERPVLKGSDVWKPAWRREGKALWSAPYKRHPWDNPEKWPKPRPGAMHRAEQVFVDGKLLVHVDTKEALNAEPGRLYTDDKEHRLWVHLDGDRPPSKRLVERSVRQQVFAPAVRGLGYIRVRGLTMRHGAAPEANGANWGNIAHRSMMSVRCGHHWIIEDNTIEWGNAQGLDVGGEGWGTDVKWQPIVSQEKGHHWVRGNRVNCHGVAGIVGWGGREERLLLEDNVTNFNCQKGNFYQYESAGVKLHIAQDCIIRRHRAHGNDCFGIWLDYRCERNRVTQCILTENRGAGFFFEVSAGPLLVDNNVIVGTRDAPRGGWAEGIYSHDGNRATYINNYIADCKGYGVRLRNLFSRIAGGRPTTTSHNRIYNNFIFDCGRGTICLNPEVPRAEDNLSDHNVVWQRGEWPIMGLEHGGTKVKWETTKIGKAMGRSGGGSLAVPLDLWRSGVGRDAQSLLFPRDLLFAPGVLPRIVRPLKGIRRKATPDRTEPREFVWPGEVPDREDGYGEAEAVTAGELVGTLCQGLNGATVVRTIGLGPQMGVQLWRRKADALTVRWDGSTDVDIAPMRRDDVLLSEPVVGERRPVTVAAGDQVRIEGTAGARVAMSGLSASVAANGIGVDTKPSTPVGEYGAIVVSPKGWERVPILVTSPYVLRSVGVSREGGNVVTVELESRRTTVTKATATIVLEGKTYAAESRIEPKKVTTLRVPVDFDAVGLAQVTVTLPGVSFDRPVPVSFATAALADGWEGARTYPMDGFPGGVFPEGAEAFALFQGGLSAKWAARYDAERLHLRARVQDDKHVQTQPRHSLWKQDSVQLLLKAHPDAKPFELDLALPSSGGGCVVFRRLWPTSKPAPGGVAESVVGRAVRRDSTTTYEASIPWSDLGLKQAPKRGTAVKLSVLVNDEDGRGRHGLQWFFGIHGHRGKEEHMGTLWLE